ncbi:HD family phosphohydrolase [Peribacillus sp. SCS-155]|uniref:HD family phosphohydrolase n=1 Tax=Peribacillus sedimenti TaxID=3115297 RepID=UPI003905788B
MNFIHRNMTKLRKLLGNRIFQSLLFVVLGLFSFLMMYSNVKPEKIKIELLKPAEQTIRATKTVEDIEETQKKREEVLKQVKDVYTLKREYAENKVDLLVSIFDSAIEVKQEADKQETEQTKDGDKPTIVSMQDRVAMLKGKLTDEVNKDIPEFVFNALAAADENQINITQDSTITVVNKVMNETIAADDVENAKKRAEDELKLSSLNPEMRNASIALARNSIIQNYFFDKDKTEEQRAKAMESVEPVRILQGQVIVEEGKLIDQKIYRQLELAGFLSSENTLFPYLGIFMFVSLVFGGLYYYFRNIPSSVEAKKATNLMIFSLVFIIAVTVMKIVSIFADLKYPDLGFFFPAAMGAMLIKILLNERFAVALTIVCGVFGTIIFNGETPGNLDFSIGLYIMFSGIASIIILSEKNFKAKILQAGFVLSLVNIILLLSILWISEGNYTKMEYLFYTVAAVVSGVGSSILTQGLLPFFEAGFGILSTMKLIELSNPNHPLLRKILTEAPGTYHHSVMVANLAESACESIGANGLLARVGCYYHDIGKTKRPQFFIENQMNIENPHDRLPPSTSRDIIIAHAIDGGDMLRKYKLPQEIIDIAEQHHGTTLLKYFYHKAIENGEDVMEQDYRYPGPRAQTKEIAVIGIADSVEAAVRSMSQPTAEKIGSIVDKIISDRLDDKQFNECDITMNELRIVRESLCETLHGIFHSRIEYPELPKLEQKVNL